MAPVARSKFGAPMFEPQVFRKQMYCIEESTCDVVKTFRRPGNCAPCPPSLRRWLLRAATRLNKSWYTALTRGIWEPWALGEQNLQFARIFAPLWGKRIGKFCGGMTTPFTPTWLRVRKQSLMAVWFWSFCCNCKPVDNSHTGPEDKFGMVSEIRNRQKNA